MVSREVRKLDPREVSDLSQVTQLGNDRAGL